MLAIPVFLLAVSLSIKLATISRESTRISELVGRFN
jgi:hypothetical protein